MTEDRQQDHLPRKDDPNTRLVRDLHVSQRDRLQAASRRLDAAALVIARQIGRQIAAERLNQKSEDEH